MKNKKVRLDQLSVVVGVGDSAVEHRSGRIAADGYDIDDVPFLTEDDNVGFPLDNMEGYTLAQMLMGPNVGVTGMHDKHLMELVFFRRMGAHPDALSLVLLG